MDITPKPLSYSLEEYRSAPSDSNNPDMFSLGYQWGDKPHRLLYDLIAYCLYLEDQLKLNQKKKFRDYVKGQKLL